MKKKLWIILPIGLILALVLAVIAFGGLEDAHRLETPAEEVLAMPDTYVRKEAKKEITINDINEPPKKVTYAATQERSGDDVVDIYVDENQIQYEVNPDSGELVGYFNKNSGLSSDGGSNVEKSATESLTESKAIAIATNQAKKIYPEEYHSFTKLSTYSNSVAYNVSFSEPGGKNGFIDMRTINVDMTPSGEITWCLMLNQTILEGFDWSLVNDLEQSTVDAFVEKELAKVGKTIEEIKSYTLKKDENYYILVRVHTPGTVEKIVYPLS